MHYNYILYVFIIYIILIFEILSVFFMFDEYI